MDDRGGDVHVDATPTRKSRSHENRSRRTALGSRALTTRHASFRVSFESAYQAAAIAQEQAREYETAADDQLLAALAEAFPYLTEVVAGHVAKVGRDVGEAFDYGLDLILEALERRRETS